MPTASDHSSPHSDHRFQQIAAILARGVRRYCDRVSRYQSEVSEPPEKELANGLEVLGETRLSVSRVSC